ncbi:hypothetical protein DUI87_14609 [Hirundo rustica rustica]|uniref:Uncharacterized protein n=1 Tax=Hirundo rustica rustica TaxID=333673 RepID=A0A3M0KMC9_HIRRU|nr:hypothetical protein DUI87_14609 [Hirundo rustica rustica]
MGCASAKHVSTVQNEEETQKGKNYQNGDVFGGEKYHLIENFSLGMLLRTIKNISRPGKTVQMSLTNMRNGSSLQLLEKVLFMQKREEAALDCGLALSSNKTWSSSLSSKEIQTKICQNAVFTSVEIRDEYRIKPVEEVKYMKNGGEDDQKIAARNQENLWWKLTAGPLSKPGLFDNGRNPVGIDTVPLPSSMHISESQQEFFRMLDEKIEKLHASTHDIQGNALFELEDGRVTIIILRIIIFIINTCGTVNLLHKSRLQHQPHGHPWQQKKEPVILPS